MITHLSARPLNVTLTMAQFSWAERNVAKNASPPQYILPSC
jgi:hypothetical protein